MNNYIASKVEFKSLDCENNIEKIEINGRIYTANYNRDPEYINDGVLDLSYYNLETEGEESEYILAFDKKEDVEDPQEWSDEYDVDNMYVSKFS